MPIYEYACPSCRVIMSFLIKTTAAGKTPSCPHCGREELERRMSRFAVKTASKKSAKKEPAGDSPDDMSPADAQRFERLMGQMGSDLDKIDENDPRQIGRFLRKFGEASGEDLGPEFREAVGRLEAGEDPEKVEEELAGAFGEDEAGGAPGAYSHDDTLYEA